jgi:hypothetical protein
MDEWFWLSSALPDAKFELKVLLLGHPDETGRRSIRGMVLLPRGIVKSAETLGLGELKAIATKD